MTHFQRTVEEIPCKSCGKMINKGQQFFYITGLGAVCRECGLKSIACDRCGRIVKMMTITVLRGRKLCVSCYAYERAHGEKRIVKEFVADSIGDALTESLKQAPEGYRLIGIRLKPGTTKTWTAEYEREDIFMTRCS